MFDHSYCHTNPKVQIAVLKNLPPITPLWYLSLGSTRYFGFLYDNQTIFAIFTIWKRPIFVPYQLISRMRLVGQSKKCRKALEGGSRGIRQPTESKGNFLRVTIYSIPIYSTDCHPHTLRGAYFVWFGGLSEGVTDFFGNFVCFGGLTLFGFSLGGMRGEVGWGPRGRAVRGEATRQAGEPLEPGCTLEKSQHANHAADFSQPSNTNFVFHHREALWESIVSFFVSWNTSQQARFWECP